eukprot:3932533-Rhodomonas_salina.1
MQHDATATLRPGIHARLGTDSIELKRTTWGRGRGVSAWRLLPGVARAARLGCKTRRGRGIA